MSNTCLKSLVNKYNILHPINIVISTTDIFLQFNIKCRTKFNQNNPINLRTYLFISYNKCIKMYNYKNIVYF